MITDGLVTDQRAIERLKFPIFCRGVSAIIAKRGGPDEGAVNVPVEVGGVTVNPGDLIVADEDGVIVCTFDEAREQLDACLELEEWGGVRPWTTGLWQAAFRGRAGEADLQAII